MRLVVLAPVSARCLTPPMLALSSSSPSRTTTLRSSINCSTLTLCPFPVFVRMRPAFPGSTKASIGYFPRVREESRKGCAEFTGGNGGNRGEGGNHKWEGNEHESKGEF